MEEVGIGKTRKFVAGEVIVFGAVRGKFDTRQIK